MATTKTVTGGVSTWVGSLNPNRNNFGSEAMLLKSGQRRGLLRLGIPVPDSRTVTSAILMLTQTNATGGSVTISARAVDDGINARKVTWANQPDVTGPTFSDTQLGRKGRVYSLDVTAYCQSVADGADNFGWRITSDTTDTVKVGAAKLVVTYSTAPRKPTELTPSTGAVSVAKPVVSCDFVDLSGDTNLAAIRVQTNSNSTDFDEVDGFGFPEWDSGLVATTVPVLDLATTSFPALVDGDPAIWWIAQTIDGDGKTSEWSDPVKLSYRSQGVLTVASPSGPFVDDFTPDLEASLTGRTMEAYRVFVTTVDQPSIRVWDTGRTLGSVIIVEVPPLVLTEGVTYRATFRAWDTVHRESTPGSPAYVEEVVEFTFAPAPLTVPTGLAVEALDGRPGVQLTWTYTDPVDQFVIERGGKVVAIVDPEGLTNTESTWSYDDFGFRPTDRTYGVRARYDGQTSDVATVSYDYPGSDGVWLGNAGMDVWVRLTRSNLDGYAMRDIETVFDTAGSRRTVGITTAMQGRSGSLAGVLAPIDDYDHHDGLTALRWIKEHPHDRYRLIGADLNDEVVVSQVTWTPASDTVSGYRQATVAFTARQVGGWDFDNVLI